MTSGQSNNYSFKGTTSLNIGNPQKVGQGTITFNREVMAGMMYDPLLESDVLSQDAVQRCLKLKSEWGSNIGAYTDNSKGVGYIRQTVADFIN